MPVGRGMSKRSHRERLSTDSRLLPGRGADRCIHRGHSLDLSAPADDLTFSRLGRRHRTVEPVMIVMTMARVADHLSLDELEGGMRSASAPKSSRHFQVIWLLAKGHTIAETSAVTAFGSRWIEAVVADRCLVLDQAPHLICQLPPVAKADQTELIIRSWYKLLELGPENHAHEAGRLQEPRGLDRFVI